MTAAPGKKNHDVQIAIVVSVVIHLLLLSLAVWEMGRSLAAKLAASTVPEDGVEEVTLLYPEQILVSEAPPVPKEEPKTYIRTTQNSAAEEAPMEADFVSDRNTVAASELPADPEGDKAMPTQEGIDKPMLELADRDYKDGELKEDGATPVPELAKPAPPAPEPAPVAAAQPAPPTPPPTPSPEPEPPPPAPAVPEPPPPAPAIAVAKAIPITPLEAMLRERDEQEMAGLDPGTPAVEVRKAEKVREPDKTMTEISGALPPPLEPVQEPPPLPPVPEMRAPAADSVPRAVPVPDPVTRTAGPQDEDSFSPFTRTSKARGTLSNRGEAAVNAAETPVGRYMRQVTSAVEKKWHSLRRTHADAVTFGSLKLRFNVLPNGDVEPPAILSNRREADSRMVDFTLRAILEAEIPPIPQDLLPLLEGRRLEVEYDVLIY